MQTIFSAIPKGITVRRLDDTRIAPRQHKPFKYTAYKGNYKVKRVYGNSIRSVLKQLGTEVTVEIQ